MESDPFEALIYTLDNGLKIYMSVNEESPRIQTNIAIKAGSKQDPADATGLAHYLEHMLFKGTSNIGTTDWEKERVLLQEISDLYEERRTITDPAVRKQIYKKIDSLSNKAEIAIANEYDKMVSSLGAQGANAYTSHEQTVYVNDIPSNEIETEENEVYFVDYDMVQTQVIMYSKGPDFDRELMPYAQMFNSYFGSGLSSIVFQEIRETIALAYSAYSYFGTPRDNTRAHYIRSFVGTQTDKLEEALDAMLDLMNDMPESKKQYNDSKLSTLKKIETNRITGESIFWNYEAAKRKGFETDPRAITYKTVESMEIEDLRTFFNENIKGEKYKFLVIGSSDSVDKEMLKKFWGL